MLGRAEPCSHLGINQCQGVVETSKGSADSCEALKKILEVGWKMMEVGAEPVGAGSPVGTGVSDGCPCLGRERALVESAAAPLLTPSWGFRRLKPAGTPDQQKCSLQ